MLAKRFQRPRPLAAAPLTASPRHLLEALGDWAEREPDRVAFRFLPDGEGGERLLTYRQLHSAALAMARELEKRGARGERALLLHPPGLEYIASLFGCWYAGAVAVPAYPPRFNRPMLRLRSLVADARARFALTTPATLERLERALQREPELERLCWLPTGVAGEAPALPSPVPLDPGDLALLQYTSGSTGDPKGVMLTHRHLLAQVELLVERGQLTSGDRGVAWLPPYHDMGLVGAILVPVLVGLETTLMPPSAFLQRPLRWLQAMTRYRATISGAPDSAFDLCVRRASPAQIEALDLGALRLLFSGAERVRPQTMERFSAAFARAGFRSTAFAPSYGLAEATLGVTWGPIGEPPRVLSLDERALEAGRVEPAAAGARGRVLAGSGVPLSGCELLVVDPETLRPQPPGRIGEIWVRSASLADGYFGRPELSERTFRARPAGAGDGPGYLRTGDLGFLHGEELFVVGRLRDLIIILGRNHHPEDLEATAVLAHPRLRPAGGAAFAVEADGEERLVVVHEVDDPRALPAEEMVDAVRGAVAEGHELAVHEVVLVPPGGVPKTSSGKVQRGRCRELYQKGELPVLAVGARAPRPPHGHEPPPALVDALCALVASVLGVGRVDADDDFFALGGHSLMATQLVSRVRETFGVDLPLRAVFEAPTPLALGARIARGEGAPPLPRVERVDRRGPLPLSFSQERIWFLHQLEPKSSAYNVTAALAVEGPLRVEELERALSHVVGRHEVLRTRFPTVDGAARVEIGPPLEIRLPLSDLGGEPHPEEAAAGGAAALAAEPFDLARDALFRVRLFRTGPDRHVVAFSLHHMVADGWSMGVLLREVLGAYAVLARGGALPADEPPLQYVDYSAWQRGALAGEAMQEHLAYWRRQMEGAPLLRLPADRPRGPLTTPRGGLEPLPLPPGLIDALREVALAEGATLFMVMLAAFEVVLARHAGQVDLVVGVPIANRNRLTAEGFVGTLVNTLPLRVRIDLEEPFSQLLRKVREASLEAYAHQDLPFERLVAEVPVERRPGQSPLVSVMFDFQNAPMPVGGAHGLRLRPLSFSRGASQFDLSLFVMDAELGQVVSAEYKADLFDRVTVRRLLGHYLAALEAVAADRHSRLVDLPLLALGEREELLALASATCRGQAPKVPFQRLFEAQVRLTPEAVAVVDAAGELTYRELDRATDALAGRLRELGAVPGRRVAVYLERSRAVVVALVAALKARTPYVPLDPQYPPDRIAYVLEDSAPAVVLTEERLRPGLPRAGSARVLSLDALGAVPGAPPVLSPTEAEAGEDLAYVLYTSGSTGRPKGVEVPALALSNFLASMSHTPGLTARDRVLSVTTIAFDIAGLELFLPLAVGARVEIASREVVLDGGRLAERLLESGATVVQATPSTWRMLVEAGWRGDGRLKVLCGGEALSRDLADALLERAGEVWNMYGPTETTIWSTLARIEPGALAPSIGVPVDHTRVYLLDPMGHLVPWGVAGEIFLGGAGVARGYLGRPELTAERFLPDPFAGGGARMYRTGDAGRLRSDGALEYLGRLDQQVKIRGHRIEPGEVEAVLLEHPGVLAVAVVAREDRPGDGRLIAYYQPRRDPEPSRVELRELCRRKLPDYMVPAHLVDLDAFPLTPNGKVDRKALPVPDERSRNEERAVAVRPRDELEAMLATVWEEVLGTPVGSVRDGFFDLGGHSLLVARVLARIEQHTGVSLPFAVFVEEPSIEHLARSIRDRQGQAPGSAPLAPKSLLAIRRGGTRSPLFCVHGAGGNVFNLHDLGRHLDPAWPLFGLQARGVEGVAPPDERIEDMARAYLAEIRARQAHGPYYLSGYCGGGIVAYEMAQQLLASGEQVPLLALIDTYHPKIPQRARRVQRWAEKLAAEDSASLWRWAQAKVRRELVDLILRMHLWVHERSRAAMPYELRDEWLTRAFVHAVGRYVFRPYPGKLTVFRARAVNLLLAPVGEDLGWGDLAQGGVDAFEVPGGHRTLMLEPHVQVLAAQLDACLAAAEREVLAGAEVPAPPGPGLALASLR